MMTAALRPAHQPTIHDPARYKTQGSPLFHVLRRDSHRAREYRHRIADWFLNGMRTSEGARILNTLFKDTPGHSAVSRKAFIHCRVRARRARKLGRKRSLSRVWTVYNIFAVLEAHLPVIVSGGRALASHAALVIGYREGGAEGRWVCVLDPGRLREEWLPCRDVFTTDATAIVPSRHDEFFPHRPDALVTTGSVTELEHWPLEARSPLREPGRSP